MESHFYSYISYSNVQALSSYVVFLFYYISVIWTVYGQCENVMVMKGHTGAIMELCFSPDGSHLYTCATDNTVAVWDVPTGTRIKKLKGHASFVNSVNG